MFEQFKLGDEAILHQVPPLEYQGWQIHLQCYVVVLIECSMDSFTLCLEGAGDRFITICHVSNKLKLTHS